MRDASAAATQCSAAGSQFCQPPRPRQSVVPAETNGHGGTSPVRRRKNAPPLAELESFLVQFVIDQTGYPPEIVRLDADLEADLGIDSIKKAQLFGELGEYFDVTPTDDLRLDQFPTLRHVLDFLKGVPGKSDWLRRGTAPPSRRPRPAARAASLSVASSRRPAASVAAGSAVAAAACLGALTAAPVATRTLASASAIGCPDRAAASQGDDPAARPVLRGSKSSSSFWCSSSSSKPAIRRKSSSSMPIWKPTWASIASRKPNCLASWANSSTSRIPRICGSTNFPRSGTCCELLQSSGDDQPAPTPPRSPLHRCGATAAPSRPMHRSQPASGHPPLRQRRPSADRQPSRHPPAEPTVAEATVDDLARFNCAA